ncbi:glycosyltransferase [Larkinella rosea]|uniref:Glycosyltransferase n=1 Tax=Larkinella rosea TaxID=2025312 RepID=A0A3P1BS66_9BACT|nr:glycosyltransferase [Larkinella rosea]RRB03940.1 glycosyltransferase [Larkinella rosea]
MKSKRILFASVPLEGHFNPLTGLAVHLKNEGYDVRWYTGPIFAEKLEKMKIPHFPFRKATEVTQENLEDVFPERRRHKSQIGKVKFDMIHYFILKTPDYFADLEDIHREFPFDLLVCDMLFIASTLVQHKLSVPVVCIGIAPLGSTSVDLPPPGLGMTPSTGFFGKNKQALLRFLVQHVIFREITAVYNRMLGNYGVRPNPNVFIDTQIRRADLYLQSGTPGFDYERSDWPTNLRFVGPLLPHQFQQNRPFLHETKLQHYKKVILVTQGTVERDVEKIIVPTLEALKDFPYLIIVTTGGSPQTNRLRARYLQKNVIIEPFLDFNRIMPYADVFVTNGGYGGVLLSITHQVAMVTAGLHEVKNEITARVGYFKLGIDLKTETPTPDQIRESVTAVLSDPQYKRNITRLSDEFRRYDTFGLCSRYIGEVLEKK